MEISFYNKPKGQSALLLQISVKLMQTFSSNIDDPVFLHAYWPLLQYSNFSDVFSGWPCVSIDIRLFRMYKI